MKEERQPQTINIFISKTKLDPEDAATTSQINLLNKLCKNRDIEFPFSSMTDAKSHLKKYEANRAIKELLERGNMIEFIYPYEMNK
jgi:hypothetical protein